MYICRLCIVNLLIYMLCVSGVACQVISQENNTHQRYLSTKQISYKLYDICLILNISIQQI